MTKTQQKEKVKYEKGEVYLTQNQIHEHFNNLFGWGKFKRDGTISGTIMVNDYVVNGYNYRSRLNKIYNKYKHDKGMTYKDFLSRSTIWTLEQLNSFTYCGDLYSKGNQLHLYNSIFFKISKEMILAANPNAREVSMDGRKVVVNIDLSSLDVPIDKADTDKGNLIDVLGSDNSLFGVDDDRSLFQNQRWHKTPFKEWFDCNYSKILNNADIKFLENVHRFLQENGRFASDSYTKHFIDNGKVVTQAFFINKKNDLEKLEANPNVVRVGLNESRADATGYNADAWNKLDEIRKKVAKKWNKSLEEGKLVLSNQKYKKLIEYRKLYSKGNQKSLSKWIVKESNKNWMQDILVNDLTASEIRELSRVERNNADIKKLDDKINKLRDRLKSASDIELLNYQFVIDDKGVKRELERQEHIRLSLAYYERERHIATFNRQDSILSKATVERITGVLLRALSDEQDKLIRLQANQTKMDETQKVNRLFKFGTEDNQMYKLTPQGTLSKIHREEEFLLKKRKNKESKHAIIWDKGQIRRKYGNSDSQVNYYS
ncbi:hypothetical protein DOK78_002378 [Enterococcus sp. DIV2402]|uniref:Uncharacterized protein n=1 Tax=Candidatus Enterococcus lowellii TaxID=2230877 RepID=A0ABZ2SPU0_9ENTE|nr:hypothetical protein [Enterococcus sp. DIV2402]MBO0463502.1 hypothetical protein [Enterococcus sp. DIV2402]